MILRDYQEECVNTVLAAATRGEDALVQLGTGLGKTEIFIEVTKRFTEANPDKRVLILLSRVLLHTQTVRRLVNCLPCNLVGEICGTKGKLDSTKPVTVATVLSAKRAAPPDLIIVDEAHTYSDRNFAMLRGLSNCPIVGFTATPYTTRGHIYGNGKQFKELTYTRPLTEFLGKWLVYPKMKLSNEHFDTSSLKVRGGEYTDESLSELIIPDKIKKQVADALPRLVNRNKIVWACVNIKHADMLSTYLNSQGESAAAIHSGLGQKEIEHLKNQFEHGPIRHVTFVTMLSEGIDIPQIDAVVLCRPTKSPVLYVQTVGRALRLHPSKTDALILDYGDVVRSCGPLDAPNIKTDRKRSDKKPSNMKACPQCFELMKVSVKVCMDCGYEFAVPIDTAIRNTRIKHSDRDILSGAAKKNHKEPEWINVNPTASVSVETTRRGDECVVIAFKPRNIFRNKIKEWINPNWANYSYKMARLGLSHLSYGQLKSMNTVVTKVNELQMDYSGFPTIVGVR